MAIQNVSSFRKSFIVLVKVNTEHKCHCKSSFLKSKISVYLQSEESSLSKRFSFDIQKLSYSSDNEFMLGRIDR